MGRYAQSHRRGGGPAPASAFPLSPPVVISQWDANDSGAETIEFVSHGAPPVGADSLATAYKLSGDPFYLAGPNLGTDDDQETGPVAPGTYVTTAYWLNGATRVSADSGTRTVIVS